MLFLLLTFIGCSHAEQTCESMFVPDPIVFSRPGDVSLAYVAQLTYGYGENYCIGPRSTGTSSATSYQYADLFAYAVAQINRNDDVLPNVTLGFTVLDGCMNWRANLARVWTLLQESCHGIPAGSAGGKLVGVVGGIQSTVAMMVSGSLGIHKIPHLAVLATSDELSNKYR